jgi:hypothetical protein
MVGTRILSGMLSWRKEGIGALLQKCAIDFKEPKRRRLLSAVLVAIAMRNRGQQWRSSYTECRECK